MTPRLREAYEGRRVLVTGDTGFKGAWLTHWLRALGADVTGLALPPEPGETLYARTGLGGDHRHVEGDVRDPAVVHDVVASSRPELVFHLAAQSLVQPSYEQPVETFATNVMGTVHLLEALRIRKERCAVVLVTSDKCYENAEWPYAYRESDPLGGHDPYSASKGACEIVAASYRRSFLRALDIRLATARAGNVVGPGDWATARIVPDILRAVFAGEPVQVRSPGAVRPWQHVLEPLSGYLWLGALLASERGAGFAKAYNFGPPPESCRTVAELVELLHAALGKGGWALDAHRTHAHEATTLRLAIDLAVSELGWRPVWGFEETMARTGRGYERLRAAPDAHGAACAVLAEIADYAASAASRGAAWAIEKGKSG